MSRLFIKIFTWFWTALILLSVSIGWGVKIYIEQAYPMEEQLPEAQVEAVYLAFKHGENQRALELLSRINDTSRRPILVLDNNGNDILHRPVSSFMLEAQNKPQPLHQRRLYIRQVTLPNDQQYLILAPRSKPSVRNNIPHWLVLLIAIVISTLVCIWLARYLSRPISKLQHASRTLANGDLSVRVGNLRGRKDEIADLAADFDAMAAKIQSLLQGRQQLLSDISHELRSPLARLQVALALVRRQVGDSADLDRIERDLMRLEELIGEVLTLSRAETLAHQDFAEFLDLSQLVKDIVRDCSLEANDKPCHLTTDICDTLTIKGNGELLRRAVENVLRNAIKYTAVNSTVSLQLKPEGEQAVLTICDQGPGIPEQQLDTIFDPFVRLDNARERQSGGYGLGLAIAKKTMEIHHGSIQAHNRVDETGLCISLKMPARPKDLAND